MRALSFSPDGQTLVSGGGDATLRFWDSASLSETAAIVVDHCRDVLAVRHSPDGHAIAVDTTAQTRVYDVVKCEWRSVGDHGHGVGESATRAVFVPGSGARGVLCTTTTVSRGGVYTWDVTGPTIVDTMLQGDLAGAVLTRSPGGSTRAVVLRERSVVVVDVTSKAVLRSFDGYGSLVGSCACLSPNGEMVVVSTKGALEMLSVSVRWVMV